MTTPTLDLARKAAARNGAQQGAPETPAAKGHASTAAAAAASGGADGGGGGDGANPILAAVGKGFAAAIAAEKVVTSPLAKIPFPGLPAATVWKVHVGYPHAHAHPPNLVPPAPPVPLPSAGPIFKAPYVSGAATVTINGSAAARCGDMCFSIWCGGYFPLSEVFTGSASVWIESMRAARLGDITKHCIFTTPKPSDPPIGPMIGAVADGSGDVKIGGVPLPSLTALAIAGSAKLAGMAAKSALKAASSAFDHFAARAAKIAAQEETLLKDFLARAVIKDVPEFVNKTATDFVERVKSDLGKIVKTKAGKKLIEDLLDSGKDIHITRPSQAENAKYGPHCMPHDGEGWVKTSPDPNGPVHIKDPSGKHWVPGRVDGPGSGSGSTVKYNPEEFPATGSPNTTSDVVLFHELTHANNAADGEMCNQVSQPNDAWRKKWANDEEYTTVQNENKYRKEAGRGYRPDYTSPNP